MLDALLMLTAKSRQPLSFIMTKNKWVRLWNDVRKAHVSQICPLIWDKLGKSLRASRNQKAFQLEMRRIYSGNPKIWEFDGSLANYARDKFMNLHGFPISSRRISEATQIINESHQQWRSRCLLNADAILENHFNILGHNIKLPLIIDWFRDYVNQVDWRPKSGTTKKVKTTDIKYLWELSRFHHGVTLGRAFALTGNVSYSEKFLSILRYWADKNLPGTGPNWACTMEVAIRAVNLLWAGALISKSQAFDKDEKVHFLRIILAHGAHIYYHLEYSQQVIGGKLMPINGNHYLSNLAGLIYISVAFPEYVSARSWRKFAVSEFYREIIAQVDNEGVNWEYSPNYHRLVLEMILSCLILLRRNGEAIPKEI